MKLYLDLDGVFADFDSEVQVQLGMTAREAMAENEAKTWEKLSRVPYFFRRLPLMPGAMRLWNAVKGYKPVFLSAVPQPNGHFVTAPGDKEFWVRQQFGPMPPVITVVGGAAKAQYCTQGAVLLDDRPNYESKWRQAGGIFVQHYPDDIDRSILAINQLAMASNVKR